MDYTIRKPNRLQEYDYATAGAYFITICTKNRAKILSEVRSVGDDAYIVPTPIGRLVDTYVQSIPGIDKYIVMPNHIHMIICIDDGPMWASAPTQSIPSRIRSFKTLITKELGYSIFQRSYYDHIIRGEQDYGDVWQYIDQNPVRWPEDTFYTP